MFAQIPEDFIIIIFIMEYELVAELKEDKKKWNFEFVKSDKTGYYLYDTGKYAGEKTWLERINKFDAVKLRLPKDYVYSLGIFEGYFFYCAEDERTKVIRISE